MEMSHLSKDFSNLYKACLLLAFTSKTRGAKFIQSILQHIVRLESLRQHCRMSSLYFQLLPTFNKNSLINYKHSPNCNLVHKSIWDELSLLVDKEILLNVICHCHVPWRWTWLDAFFVVVFFNMTLIEVGEIRHMTISVNILVQRIFSRSNSFPARRINKSNLRTTFHKLLVVNEIEDCTMCSELVPGGCLLVGMKSGFHSLVKTVPGYPNLRPYTLISFKTT